MPFWFGVFFKSFLWEFISEVIDFLVNHILSLHKLGSNQVSSAQFGNVFILPF